MSNIYIEDDLPLIKKMTETVIDALQIEDEYVLSDAHRTAIETLIYCRWLYINNVD